MDMDNIKVKVKPLYCGEGKGLGYTGDSAFQSMCIGNVGEKPVVYVNHANSYFNISGEM